MADKVLCELQRGNDRLRVTVGEWQGRPNVQVRVWTPGQDGGDFVPTKKGVALHADELDAVIEGLQEARGLLSEASEQ